MCRRKVFLVTIAFGCLLAVGCGDKKGKEAAKSESAGAAGGESAAAVEEAKPAVWEGDYECKDGDAECRDDKVGGTGVYFNGTVFNTIVNTNVTVRGTPTKNGESLFLAKKDTKAQVLGIYAGWVNVSVRDVVPKRGWVYGQYIDYKEGVNFAGLKAVDMKVADFQITAKDSATADLTVTYEANGAAKTVKIVAFKEKGQKFFTFFFDAYTEGAHYIVPPGLYTWDFVKNQLRITVPMTRDPYTNDEGNMAIWKKVKFTDDKKFFFVGDRAESGAVTVYRVSDRKRLFDWNFKKGCDNVLTLGLKNSTVTCACPTDAEMAKNYTGLEEMDAEIDGFTADIGGPGESVCEVNLETGARRVTETRLVTCE